MICRSSFSGKIKILKITHSTNNTKNINNMKIFVKTLKGTHFEIQVKPEDTVDDVKKNIEIVQGPDVYPATLQMLIFQGKVLKDGTTLDENKVINNSFIVVMLTKNKDSPGEGSTTSTATTTKAPHTSGQPPASNPISNAPQASLAPPAPTPASAPPVLTPAPTSTVPAVSDGYGQAASNLITGNILDETIQQILDMGGGTWDRATVIRAHRAAYNNPERAVEYLYSGIPERAEAPPVPPSPASGQAANPPTQSQPLPVPSSGPNASPLDLFPQGIPNMGSNTEGAGSLDFLRNNPQFQGLRAMVQANPQILQPMLQELGKRNPNLLRLIQAHQADFLSLINEPVQGGDSGPLEQVGSAVPQSIAVTPEERDAIERLEAMGFNRAIVLQVFFACNKNEELAANYLLDHMHEFEE